MHILLIHQGFVTADEAGGTRHYELARHLVARGHRMTVVASPVNVLTGQSAARERGPQKARRVQDGVEIRYVKHYGGLHRSYFTRFLTLFSFMLSAFLTALRVRRVDIVWGTTPPIFQAVTAYVAARVTRVPFCLEVRDLWPAFAVGTGVLKSRLLIRASEWLERRLYHGADRIIVNSPGFIPHLRSCGVAANKIELVPNGVDVSLFQTGSDGADVRRELGWEGKYVAMYTGAHGLANDLGTLVQAATHLKSYPDIVLALVGDGKERQNLIHQAEALGLTNVRFVPAQPKARMPSFLAAADVCIAILQPIAMFTTTYPNKVFDYMAAGRPTVLAIDGVIRQVIEAAQGGTFVSPGKPEALAEAILAYYRSPEMGRLRGENARRYVSLHFKREQHALKLEEVLEKARR